jgi:hypothetical protein
MQRKEEGQEADDWSDELFLMDSKSIEMRVGGSLWVSEGEQR